MLIVIIIISTQSEVGDISLPMVDCQGNFHVCLFEITYQDYSTGCSGTKNYPALASRVYELYVFGTDTN